ncbi:uncharacterized protein LOC141655705 [Silene latifolia]|uniref:uncharacterized protein LOC141655705 n=1 Tax=Silene latifolia TaxID=37657 RepID=UPI003D7765E3
MQFRPIACCNTVYKCLSKVICGRLNQVLPDIINPSQSAFLKGRDIVGNILICQDLVKLYNRKSCSPRMLMKIDLQKAYDSVEWAFMNDMMLATGFPDHFCQLTMGKSNFYCNGVDNSLVKEIEELTGMQQGSVPFKYLGVNVSSKRLSVLDCHYLPEKIVARIRSLGSKKLSYAGRLVLIQTYLWHESDQKESPALVSWSQVCNPLKQGGLGLRDLHSWNIAAIGKYVWWVAMKTDHLWFKWVHSVEHYTLRQGYQWLKPDGDKVRWYPWMLNSWIIPRHTFLCWLVAQQRFLTQDRLLRMGIIQINCCFLCGLEEESHEHLFFGCIYSKICLQLEENRGSYYGKLDGSDMALPQSQ